jgi:hypothetical protein
MKRGAWRHTALVEPHGLVAMIARTITCRCSGWATHGLAVDGRGSSCVADVSFMHNGTSSGNCNSTPQVNRRELP